uniref:Ribosomal protein S6 kinase n=1 Tax=Panagrellus redivivus TaxID=6233 RepID=A0A7E4V8S0_PANRE
MDNEGDRVSMENFALIRVLGKGAYGKVFLVKKVGGHDNGRIYAMKVLKKERVAHKQKTLEHTLAERVVLERLKGQPFLVNMIYAFQSEMKLHIVMEFVGGGELFTHLCKRKMFDIPTSRALLAELVAALDLIHRNNVIYRDLKLENILLDSEGHIKLTDFGLSKELKEQRIANSYCGTIEYMAPEVVKRTPKGYNECVDWWSLGVIAFELITGCSPFTVDGDQNTTHDIAKRILNKRVPFPKTIDESAKSLISGLLEKDATIRLGAKGVIEIKNHPFFKGINWEMVEARKMPPAIRPVVAGKMDVNNFAPEFTNQAPLFSPAGNPADYKGIFRGYSFVSPSVIFDHNNPIGAESLEESVKLLSKNSTFFAKYSLDITDEGFLGRGSFSVCRKCKRLSDGKLFAVKITSTKCATHAAREIRILDHLGYHENIVRVEEALTDPLHYYIVEELLEGGELLKRLRKLEKFTEKEAARIMTQLVSAVSHMHSKGVVHRDLKPENIIFENESPEAKLRLIDFGFARLLPNTLEALSTPCYTLQYAAPEVLETDDELPQYNQQCDLWSLGVILFTMISGHVPFHAKATTDTANDIIARIRLAEFSFVESVWDSVSDLAKDLITGLLTVDPKKRLSLQQLARHPWLRAKSEDGTRELQTPTILPSTADDSFNETFNAFLSANKDGFQLMDVDTAPLLVKRRGLKRRSDNSAPGEKGSSSSAAGSGASRKVSAGYDQTKLAPVPEASEGDSRPSSSMSTGRPNTLQFNDGTNRAFMDYRDPVPPYMKYSRDVEPESDRRVSGGSEESSASSSKSNK